MMGVGHDDYCKIRLHREGLFKAQLEKTHRYVVYFGRLYVKDHVTGHVSGAYLKIGQSTIFNVLQRGRNQAGGDFRILAELCFADAKSAQTAEQHAHHIFMNLGIAGPQNQTELYNIQDDQVLDFVKQLRDYCTVDSDRPLPLLETLMFSPNQSYQEL
jgi:hypothetical protein